MKTPIGTMVVNSDGDVHFLQKTLYQENFGDILISVKMNNFHNLDQIDFEFIITIIDNINFYVNKAITYLFDTVAKTPSSFGYNKNHIALNFNKNALSEPSITFYDEYQWSILFSEECFPICEPYGISVNFYRFNITDFDNLSSAEEI